MMFQELEKNEIIKNKVHDIDIKELNLVHKGKIRSLYNINEETFLMVTSDKISAYDCVFPNPIPNKGVILNKISNFWFNKISFIKNHIIETNINKFTNISPKYKTSLKDRSVMIKKCIRIDYECVVRGYIIGSGWRDYQKTGKVCGIKLPKNLKQAQKLLKPLFTPARKNDQGHDENISYKTMKSELGHKLASKLKNISLIIYKYASEYVYKKGLILADTKFEFGLYDGELLLIDELLTPDSSRYWFRDTYKIGTSPVSLDKQYLRDFVDTLDWDKNPPAPNLPEDVILNTIKKYKLLLNILTKDN